MESIKEFARDEKGQLTPQGWAAYWSEEFRAAREAVKDWHEEAVAANDRFRDGRKISDVSAVRRINLFTANIQTLRSMLYGKTPTVDVARRFNDQGDDVARVAAETLQRLLNADIERDSDSYAMSLQYALDDRLLAGMGNVRLRYDAEFEDVEVPPQEGPCPTCRGTGQMQPMMGEMPDSMSMAMPPETMCPTCGGKGQMELAPGYTENKRTNEDVDVEYVYWKDQLWSPCRVFGEVRWWGFRAEMRRDEARERFPEDADHLPTKGQSRDEAEKDKNKDPWDRIEVWEVWCREHGKVFWFVEGYERVLDQKDDPLGLEGFWPFPQPMMANLTTTALIPKPDFAIARDLYNEVDDLTTRIGLLEDAVRVAGLYDESNVGVQRLLTEKGENCLYPVQNWAMFAEKGGINGAVAWMPLKEIVEGIAVLTQKRDEKIQMLYQVTGLSDIMRGAATAGATATEQAIKARFASVRVQALQDEFARFASDVQRIKAEIISKHFDPQTIVDRSNLLNSPDKGAAQQVVELIKSKGSDYRVQVKPESVSMTDFAQLKSEAMEVLQTIGGFGQAMAPLVPMMGPGGMKIALEILSATLARLKGGDVYEAILDRGIAEMEKAAMMPKPPPPPDPKMMLAQAKVKGDMQKTQMDVQAHAMKKQIDVAADMKMRQNDAQFDIAKEQARAQAEGVEQMNRALPER